MPLGAPWERATERKVPATAAVAPLRSMHSACCIACRDSEHRPHHHRQKKGPNQKATSKLRETESAEAVV